MWAVVQDHVNGDLLFAGTEFACSSRVDGGQRWVQLKGGLPDAQIRDMDVQKRETDLVLGTFGRSFYVLDDYSALREVSAAALAEEARLFPLRHAYQYPMLGQTARGAERLDGAQSAVRRASSRITCAGAAGGHDAGDPHHRRAGPPGAADRTSTRPRACGAWRGTSRPIRAATSRPAAAGAGAADRRGGGAGRGAAAAAGVAAAEAAPQGAAVKPAGTFATLGEDDRRDA